MIADDRSTMVEQNLKLVHSCANRFRGRGIEYDDLFQAGCLGLLKAISSFDENRGVMFSTYATPVIWGEIRQLFRDGGTVKVSRRIKELGVKAAKVQEQMSISLGRDATIHEVAQAMSRTPGKIKEALEATIPPISLTSGEEEGGGQIDLLVDSPEEQFSDILALKQVMEGMEEPDRKLIILRYYQNRTQTETARELEMTQVQVSRREKKLIQYFRKELLD